MDSQHVQAHYQPAYGFIGLWAPCERGYHNTHRDGDMRDYYGSLERFYAHNPSHAFGQIPCALGLHSARPHFDQQARETRVMMMLALLHDQTIGGIKSREVRTECRLREARNVFRQWEDDVDFVGYWDSSGLLSVTGAQPDTRHATPLPGATSAGDDPLLREHGRQDLGTGPRGRARARPGRSAGVGTPRQRQLPG
jgi:hypothetical protein